MKFYDRGNEIEIIRNNEESSKQSAKFTVLMGRRRVGKRSRLQ